MSEDLDLGPTTAINVPNIVKPEDLLAMYDAEAKPEPGENAPETPPESPEPDKQPETTPEPAPTEKPTTIGQEATAQTLKGKFNGQDIDIPLDVEITQKVNGKDVTFKANEAIQAFVKQEEFNRKMDARLATVANREQQLASEIKGVKAKAVDVVNAALKGDFFSAIRNLAKVAAGRSQFDMVAFEKAYLEQIDKYHEAYAKMSPEQREKFFAERKASVYEEENKTLRTEKERSDALQSLNAQISQLCEQSSVQLPEFWETYQAMAEKLVGEGKDFKSADDILPEQVIQQINVNRHVEKVFEAAKKVNINHDDPRLDDVIRITLQRSDLTVDDIAQIIEKSGLVQQAPKASVENLNRKAQKAGSSPQAASSTKKANGKIEGYDEEDMNFLLRHAPKTYQRIPR